MEHVRTTEQIEPLFLCGEQLIETDRAFLVTSFQGLVLDLEPLCLLYAAAGVLVAVRVLGPFVDVVVSASLLIAAAVEVEELVRLVLVLLDVLLQVGNVLENLFLVVVDRRFVLLQGLVRLLGCVLSCESYLGRKL